jgi:MFS family permease
MSRVGDALRETGTSLSTVFRNPGLRRVNLAFAGSAIGDWAYATGIVVWAYSVGGVTAVGIWGTVRLILMAVVTPFASLVVDRFSRKLVMVSTDLIRAVLVFLVAGLIAAHAPVLLIFALATITSLVAAPFRPAVAALLPSLVTKPEELTAANGTTSTIESLAFFVGPALGGILLTVASIPVVVVFDGLTFLWSAALVSRIVVAKVVADVPAEDSAPVAPVAAGAVAGDATVDGPAAETIAEEAEEAAAGFLSESMAGFRTIWAHPDLRLISGVYCAQTVVAGASIVFGVEMATQMTPFGSAGVGYLDSVLGIGAILGGLVAIGRAAAKRLATDFGWGVVFWAVPLLLAAAWPHAGAAFAAVFIIGFANPIVDVNASTILQRLADDSVMGRVFGALETGLIAAMALGSIVFPILNQWLGLRWALAILAVGVTVTVLPSFGRLRRLDATLGEPDGLPVLRSLPLFSPLDAKSLEDIARKLGRTEVPAGTPIITEGETGDRFYIVESGRTTATHHGQVLSTQGPGEPFGEIALLRDVPRTATVIADEDTVLFFLERDDFLAAVSGDNEVANRADDLVSRRIPTY